MSLDTWRSCPLLVLSLLLGLAEGPAVAQPLADVDATTKPQGARRATSNASPIPFGTTRGGRDRAVVIVPEGVDWQKYANAGYRTRLIQSPIERSDSQTLVEIAVDLRPIGDSSPFELPPTTSVGELEVLAHKQAAGARTAYEASARILTWVSRNIDYELDRTAPQDPQSVLARRNAYCTGVARLTVALLEAVGISAREVPGVVYDGRFAGLHRWVEHHLPDQGWVFSDPLASHFWVPATYLRLDSGALTSAGPPQVAEMLERTDQTTAVDVHSHGPHWIAARANVLRQRAPALAVELEGRAIGEARLRGAGREYVGRLKDGRAEFVGLEPATYALRIVPEVVSATSGSKGDRSELGRVTDIDLRANRRHSLRLIPIASEAMARSSGEEQ